MVEFTCKTKKGVAYRRAFLRNDIYEVTENPTTKEVSLLLRRGRGFKRRCEWVVVENAFDEVLETLRKAPRFL